jgi:hypothetical protein
MLSIPSPFSSKHGLKGTSQMSCNLQTLLGFFASLKVDVKQIYTQCTSREKMIANVMKAFEEYPRKKIDGLWAK